MKKCKCVSGLLSLLFKDKALVRVFSISLALFPSLFDTLLVYFVSELLFHTAVRYQVMLALGIAVHTFWYKAMTINRFTRSAPTSNAARNVRVLLVWNAEGSLTRAHF